MTVLKRLGKPVSACLMGLLVTSCQTAPVPSSSVVEETAEGAAEIQLRAACESLVPPHLDGPEAFDAMSPDAREILAEWAVAWIEAGCHG